MNNVPNQDNRSEKVIAGFTGAGSGTVLVLLANNLPETSALKSWLVILAPSVSILMGSIYHWVKSKVSEHFAQKDFTAAIESARETLNRALNNSTTTEAHKEVLREQLEKLEKIEADVKMNKVKILAENNA